MRKQLKGLLAVLLLLSMLLPGMAFATLDCGDSGQSHVWGEWMTRPEPTCTESGTRIRFCQNCGNGVQTETIPALGHDWGKWETEVEATCAREGLRFRYCTRCQAYQEESVAKAEHQYDGGKITKEPTCTEKGIKTYTCTVCQAVRTEDIPAKGHTLADRVAKEASCAEAGTQETYCTVCGAVTKTAAIKATGSHTFGDWQITKEATCKQNGTKARVCSVCGKQETETISKTTAHQYGDWVETTPASCKSAGIRTRSCSICGNRQTETIPKLEHNYGEWNTQKEATCTRDGREQRVCSLCGASQHRVLKALGHTYSGWEITEEATDESKGTRSSVCDRCGKALTESFYPEGTLFKGGDNPPDAVIALQQALADLGLYKGKLSENYGNGTFNAVRNFQKNYLGMKSDGIAWPKVLKGLGLKIPGEDPGGIGGGFDEPVSSDTSKVKLLLEAEQLSPKKDAYAEGDEITIQWTLTNKSPKDDATSVRVYMFRGMKENKKTDTEIAQPETLVPGEKMSGTYVYTVTAEDTVKSTFTVGFIARCRFGKKDGSSNKVWFHFPSSSSGMGSSGWTPPGEQQLAISKKVDNDPKNKYFFVKGETIEYLITVANTSKEDVDNVILTDPLFPGLGEIGSFSLKAGDIRFFAAAYKVKADDIPGGEVINTVIASYTGSDGKLKSAKASAKAPVGMGSGALFVYKTAVSAPANGLFYLEGEVVTYDITVINPTGKTFTDVRLFDELNTDPKVPIKKIGTMAPYDVKTVTFRHHVSRFEARTLHKVINSAYVTYIDPNKAGRQESSNICIVPAGTEYDDGVIVKKTIISTPENGKYYEDAEEIRYMIEVTNNTVLDIPDMDVRDMLAPLDTNGFRTAYGHESLPAGETRSFPFSFIVGPGDVENTYVVNIASATWTIDGKDYWETFSDPVIAPTAEVMAPRTAKQIRLEGAACENPLTGVGEGVTEHDVTECEDHADTAARSMQLVDEKAYDDAKSLWNEEIDELYAEWVGHADAESARNAEDEKAAFELHTRALENSIGLICSPEEAKSIAVEERMNKCVRLCYELHSAPDTRSDSLDSDYTALPKAGAGSECRHSATYLENGSAHVVDGQCESHRMTARLTGSLLENAADSEERAAAWRRIQNNWLLQLNTMYDRWYLSADESQRAIIAADRMSFDRLIEARRKTLSDLYPDNPAAAEEVLANMVMERTELICRLLHNAGILKD